CVLALCLTVKRIIELVRAATPFLMGMVLIITAYSLFTSNANLDQLLVLAQEQETIAPHWVLGAVLYASFNIAVGFPMLAVISGRTQNVATSSLGGMAAGSGLSSEERRVGTAM